MIAIGIDLGTSGVRAVAMNARHEVLAESATPMAAHGSDPRDPATWWRATQAALDGLACDRAAVRALAVDGTSGTLLALGPDGAPLGPALLYNDPVTDPDVIAAIAAHAPATSAAHGATSGLAKAMLLQRAGPARLLHQADWISGQFSGRWVTDANNALKTGFDPVAGRWPDWIAETGARTELLPEALLPGTVIGPVTAAAAARFGLPRETLVVAGTTDGCASFLATGASVPGDAVTALGTTLTVKMLSDRPIFAAEFGIYSHRIGDTWLAGGASNSGGAVLLQHFTAAEIASLSAGLDDRPSGLDYYPLPGPGERFPIADPTLAPRLSPRPPDDASFLKALLEGIAGIEALGYSRLTELGAPALRSVRTVGGGARNPAWTRMRAARLAVPFEPAASDEAAAGVARLALGAIA